MKSYDLEMTSELKFTRFLNCYEGVIFFNALGNADCLYRDARTSTPVARKFLGSYYILKSKKKP